MKMIKSVGVLFTLVLCISFVSCGENIKKEGNTYDGSKPMTESNTVSALSYPENTVKTLEQRQITENDFVKAAACETSYEGNRHAEETQIIVSPHYTAETENISVPVYAVPVYVSDGNYGTLHSYAAVSVSFESIEKLKVTFIKQKEFDSWEALLVSDVGGSIDITETGFSVTVEKTGTYTVVCGNSQQYAVTLFVRQKTDEQTEIDNLKQQYGEENVVVYEKGLHEIDYINLIKKNQVLYLCAGAVVLPKHTFDITDDASCLAKTEDLASYCNSLGLTRFPVINAYNTENIRIYGQGTIDMSRLDWHERRGAVFCNCTGITVENLIVINPCEWAFIFHRCRDVVLRGCAVFGYRCNSDAFAICNTADAEITDCFARTGDDMFEVKTLSGDIEWPTKNVLFERCAAWGSKARCFGVTGEIEQDISNVTFRNSTVIWRDAVWNNDRIGSLVIIRECGTGTVSDILFENIRVLNDLGRAINCTVLSKEVSGTEIRNIDFRNISYKASMKSQLKQLGADNRISVCLNRVTANGETVQNSNDFFETFGQVEITTENSLK